MVSFIATTSDFKLGLTLTLAIIFHNIPEGISISVPIYYATNKKSRAVGYTIISALSEPLGAILTYLFLRNYLNDIFLSILYALIAGIMFNISLGELLPESISYKMINKTKIYFLIGIGSTLIIHLFLN